MTGTTKPPLEWALLAEAGMIRRLPKIERPVKPKRSWMRRVAAWVWSRT